MALLGPREMSDLSPQSGPKRTLDQVAVTNRDFLSTRPKRQHRVRKEADQSRAEAAQRGAAGGNELFRQQKSLAWMRSLQPLRDPHRHGDGGRPSDPARLGDEVLVGRITLY